MSESNDDEKMKPTKVFVTNLDGEVWMLEEDDLKEMFGKYGQLDSVVTKRSYNGEYCFAFIEYKEGQDANQAVKNLNQQYIGQRKMRVELQDNSRRRKGKYNFYQSSGQGCYLCGKVGHFARQCRTNNDNKDRRDRNRSNSRDRHKSKKRRHQSQSSDESPSLKKKCKGRQDHKQQKRKKVRNPTRRVKSTRRIEAAPQTQIDPPQQINNKNININQQHNQHQPQLYHQLQSMHRLACLIRTQSPFQAVRGPKKKKQEAKIQSNDIINIFKQRPDPQLKPIEQYPIYVQQFIVGPYSVHELFLGSLYNLPYHLPNQSTYKSYLRGLKRQTSKYKNEKAHIFKKFDIHNEQKDFNNRMAIYNYFSKTKEQIEEEEKQKLKEQEQMEDEDDDD